MNIFKLASRFKRLSRLQFDLERCSVYRRDHRKIAQVLESRIEILLHPELSKTSWAVETWLEMNKNKPIK